MISNFLYVLIHNITLVKEHAKQLTNQQLLDDDGPLESLFPCSESKILDHMITMKAFDYSISDIAEISGVGIKTTMRVVRNLESQGILLMTRNVGRAIMFKINPDSERAKTLERLAFQIADKRIREMLEE